MKIKKTFEKCTKKSIKITKIQKWWIKKMRIQLENVNENSIRKWKFNLKIEIKVQKLERKFMKITEIDK